MLISIFNLNNVIINLRLSVIGFTVENSRLCCCFLLPIGDSICSYSECMCVLSRLKQIVKYV